MMSYSSMAYGYMKSFYENGKWFEMENNQSCLYVGTEMDLNTQVIPQIACCAGCCNYQHSIKKAFPPDEWNRFSESVKRLYESNSVFLENEPDYDRTRLGNLVSGHIKTNNIKAVFLDYMEVTSATWIVNTWRSRILLSWQ